MKKICNICGELQEHKSYKSNQCKSCEEAGLKFCPVCNQAKSVGHFGKNGKLLRSRCKQCETRKSVENKAKNNYYSRPEVQQRRRQQSREYKKTKYNTDEEYRIAEIKRCHERRTNLEGSYTIQEWLEVVQLFDCSCVYCGSKHNLTVEHVIPIALGGTNNISNIVPACASCNSSKQDRELISWYTSKPFYDEARLNNILKYINRGGGANANDNE